MTENNQPNKPLKTPTNNYFDDISKKSQEQNWQYKVTKCRYNTFTLEHKYNNTAAWKINSLKRLLIKIEKDLKIVLSMILDI